VVSQQLGGITKVSAGSAVLVYKLTVFAGDETAEGAVLVKYGALVILANNTRW
jgi:hypothetical protein